MPVTVVTFVYVAGVVLGLVLADARPAQRAALALLWPLGPIAFVVTTVLLVALAIVTNPLLALATALAAAAAWFALG